MTTAENRLQETGRSQYESIRELVAALDCDYDRLEELRDEYKSLVEAIEDTKNDEPQEEYIDRVKALGQWEQENGEEYAELQKAAGECEDREEAEQRIQEDALSIEVRSDWTTFGEPLEPGEYLILLCTGGPAARITGQLRDGEPASARLEVQDWGTPWTEYREADVDVLLGYASVFYFGS